MHNGLLRRRVEGTCRAANRPGITNPSQAADSKTLFNGASGYPSLCFWQAATTALVPRTRWSMPQSGRRTPVLCPRVRQAALSGSFESKIHHLQAVNIMALVSGRRTLSTVRSSNVANVLAAIENQLMAKVLLIEDDSETAEEITAELADRGFEVEWSANGIDGLDKARSSQPDAMIVDRLLPGMDGLTVIEALRKDQVRTPVLVLSALGAVDDRVRGLRMGGDDYLTKPFAVVELIARIEALLRRPPETRETTLRVG